LQKPAIPVEVAEAEGCHPIAEASLHEHALVRLKIDAAQLAVCVGRDELALDGLGQDLVSLQVRGRRP
jgi:hypothetical protein